MDRQPCCFLGWKVAWERTQEVVQDLVDEAVKAKRSFRDAFAAYARLWFHGGQYEVSQAKRDAYSLERGHTDLRHYLARSLRRKEALEAAQRRAIYGFNRLRCYQQQFPQYQTAMFPSISCTLAPLPFSGAHP